MQNTQGKFFTLSLLVVASFVIYLIAPVLSPFLVGMLLAYLANPLVNKLMLLKLSRTLSVSIVFAFIFLLLSLGLLAMIPFITSQIEIMVNEIPNTLHWVDTVLIPWTANTMGFEADLINISSLKTLVTENLSKATGLVNWLVTRTLHSGSKIFGWFLNLLLIPVVMFYLLCDWDKLVKNLRDLLPRRIEPTIVKLVTECDAVLSEFLRGQLVVMLALAIVYTVGLGLIGLKTCLLVGLLIGVLSIIPYLGIIIGFATASISMYLQADNMISILWVLLVFVIGHIIDQVFLTPRLLGKRIGLHPVVVIFAVLAGGSLFGFVGVLLALPVAAMLMVWLRYWHHNYQDSQLYRY